VRDKRGPFSFPGHRHSTSLLLDLCFKPRLAPAGKTKVSCGPFTYLNRLLMKKDGSSAAAYEPPSVNGPSSIDHVPFSF
jgi:hypothetical protein